MYSKYKSFETYAELVYIKKPHLSSNLNNQTGPTCVHRLTLYLDRGQHFAAVQEVKVVYITAMITSWTAVGPTVVLVDEG